MADDEDLEHPALKNFSEGAFTAKHVAKKTLKSGLIGAAAGGIGFGAIALMASGAALSAIPIVGPIAMALGVTTTTGMGIIGSALAGAATTGALVGGGVGSAIGLVTSGSNADDAVRDKKEEIIAQAERGEIRKERSDALQMRRAQMHAAMESQSEQMGVAQVVPQQGLPQGQRTQDNQPVVG